LVIWRPAPQVYEAWRAFDRLPAILRHVERVDVIDERRSRWSVRAPGGKHVEWEAEIVEDRPGEVLAWRSLDGSPLQQLGSLHFDRWRDGGTLLRVDLRLLPAGAAGIAVAALLQPLLQREIHEDLRRFKRSLEAGEVPSTEGQPHGERGRFDIGNPL
ncbi:MAG TPA: SRPBCC family protein, partial [Thermoanaerobaculia bacterium]|nr:SRPBCC family protein [Thermoanaerobaculia bacterium]